MSHRDKKIWTAVILGMFILLANSIAHENSAIFKERYLKPIEGGIYAR